MGWGGGGVKTTREGGRGLKRELNGGGGCTSRISLVPTDRKTARHSNL